MPAAVETGERLNSIDAALFSGEGASTLGEAEGSTDASGEALSVATGARCRGLRSSCCGAFELELVVLEFSGAVCRDIAK